MANNEIELGDLCRDLITHYEGVAIAVAKHITGCDRVTLQAQGVKDGKLAEGYNFDITTVEVIKRGVVPVDEERRVVPQKRAAGGPPTKANRF